jgi:hypothetical protein
MIMKKNKFNLKTGFSLIEVMVATTILMIIIIMVGNIFRHASSAWDTGYSSSEGIAGVRSVLGIFQRELADAIDGRKFEKWSLPINVTGTTVEFYRYVDPRNYSSKNGDSELEIQKITYSFSDGRVTRQVGKEKPISLYSKPTSVGDSSNVDIVFEVACLELDPKTLDINENIEDFWNIPFVWVKAIVKKNSTMSQIEARSYGPDGERGTKDDIVAR